jgi:two-component system, LytTR family, response regulator LytT
LKPIDEDDLEVAIGKYKSRTNQDSMGSMEMATIRQLFSTTKDVEYRKRFRVKIGDHIKIIPIEGIELIYNEYKGSYLHSLEGRTYLLDNSIDAIEKELEPKHFFRVN